MKKFSFSTTLSFFIVFMPFFELIANNDVTKPTIIIRVAPEKTMQVQTEGCSIVEIKEEIDNDGFRNMKIRLDLLKEAKETNINDVKKKFDIGMYNIGWLKYNLCNNSLWFFGKI